MPTEGYSSTVRDFVRACLNKVPKLRPAYSDLLRHAWLAKLSGIDTIEEGDEEAAEAEAAAGRAVEKAAADLAAMHMTGSTDLPPPFSRASTMSREGSTGSLLTEDAEVAAWVRGVLDRKRAGTYGSAAERPALHAAPLDSASPIGSPQIVGSGGGSAATSPPTPTTTTAAAPSLPA